MPEVVKFQLQDMVIKNLTQRTIAHLSGKGTGKTTLLKMAVEALPDRMPALIIDPLNVIEIDGVLKILIKRSHVIKGFLAAPIVNDRIRKHKKVILSFVNLLGFEIVEFMDSFVPKIKMKGGMWFFDEIHEVCPEVGTVGGKYSIETERLIRHVRNQNCGIWMNSQRPSFTSKRVLALNDFLILMRLTWISDIEIVQKLTHDKEIANSLASKSFLQGITIDYDPESGKYLKSTPVEILKE